MSDHPWDRRTLTNDERGEWAKWIGVRTKALIGEGIPTVDARRRSAAEACLRAILGDPDQGLGMDPAVVAKIPIVAIPQRGSVIDFRFLIQELPPDVSRNEHFALIEFPDIDLAE